jgi:hypothetical protein
VGHQLNFFATTADLETIERHLRAHAPLAILHDRSPLPQPRSLNSLNAVADGKPVIYMCLARVDDLRATKLTHVPAQHYWAVDTIRSPVIEFTKPVLDGSSLRRGRFYYVDGFFTDSVWIEKDVDYCAWARDVLRIVRKCLIRKDGAFIGRDATTWLEIPEHRLAEEP